MRRPLLGAIAAGSLILCSVPAFAADEIVDIEDLTLLATTDTHGTALNHDYYTGEPFGTPEDPEGIRGMEHLATAIGEIREREGKDAVILVDNGDANQGNALESVYHAGREAGTADPMAAVLNHLDYDSGVVGNHEFNYGLEDLAQYEENLEMPLLGANVIDRATGEPAFDPYTLIEKTTADGHPITIGVVGVVTPGVRVWDRDKVQSLEFQDTVSAAQQWVPKAREAGADIVVVTAHTGLDPEGQTWEPEALREDTARSLAQNVPGIDVIVGGHSHSTDDVQQYFTNPDGREVLYTQPGYHARFLSEVDLPLQLVNGEPRVQWDEVKPTATAHRAADYPADPQIREVIEPWHTRTEEWVGTKVAVATETLSGQTSPWEDTAILDFVGDVMRQEVSGSLEGTEQADLPVIAQVSPFSRDAVFPEGDVTIADMAGLYTFDNTLLGVEVTGAQVKDYLEHAAQYYKDAEEGEEIVDGADYTNAATDTYPAPRGMPDYALDILDGINYDINISQPVGQRIENLTYEDGTALADDDRLVLAINNFRQAGGGGGYPHVTDAPIVYDEQVAIREMLIAFAEEKGIIDPANFHSENWRLTTTTLAPLVPAPGEEDPGRDEPGEGEEPTDPPADDDAPGEGEQNPAPEDEPTTPSEGEQGTGQGGTPPQADGASGPLARTGVEPGTLLGLTALLSLGGAVLLHRSRVRG